MAEWALLALEPHTSAQVAVTNDPRVTDVLGVPGRPDRIPDLGPLGGLHAALEWAGELGHGRVFLLACDLPLVSASLVGRILEAWPEKARASVPVSPGPLGFEPLCAGYSAKGLPRLNEVIHSGDRSMERVLSALGTGPVSLGKPWTLEALSFAFTNVNTRDEARRVEILLAGEPGS